MKKEIADKWVEALRSGKYKKGVGRLKNNDDTFCCLGVLCDISGLDEWDEHNLYFSGRSYLPHNVQKWAEMHSDIGKFEEDLPALAALNDHGKSFEEIADVIEEQWKKL